MLKKTYEILNKESDDVPLQTKLKDAVFSSMKIREVNFAKHPWQYFSFGYKHFGLFK